MVLLVLSRNIGEIPTDSTTFRALRLVLVGPSVPGLGDSSVFVSRGKEFGHDVDIIFTTLELGMEENLLLAVIKSLEKQVGPKTFSVCFCPSGGEGVNRTVVRLDVAHHEEAQTSQGCCGGHNMLWWPPGGQELVPPADVEELHSCHHVSPL